VVVAFLVPDRRVEEPVIELGSDYPVPPLDLTVPTPSRHRLRSRPIASEHEPARSS
jgi:NADH-quinone oxidoreductase subunit H